MSVLILRKIIRRYVLHRGNIIKSFNRAVFFTICSLGALLSAFTHAQPSRIDHIQSQRPSVSRNISRMTTTVDFEIVTNNTHAANIAIDAAIEEIDRIDALMSEWRPHSVLSKINNEAAIKPVQLTSEVFTLLQEALRISQLSSGKFDPSFKSAGKLWDFRTHRIPTEEAIEAAVASINYKNIVLDSATQTVRLKTNKTQIGLGGIAKGYIVDRAAQIIAAAGFAEFTVNAGGDLYAASEGNIKRWRVGVQHPRKDNQLIAILPVANAAVASSGDYERFFEKDGQRFHHIIDPDTGYPAKECQSVTILAPRAYLADALATAVFVLGPKQGMRLIESLDGVEGLIVDAHSQLHISPSLQLLN